MKSSEEPSRTSPRRRYDARGRQASALERQRHILRTATDLFLERGYGATSIDQIAKAAGVSSQSIYASFESKAGVLEQAVGLIRTGDEHGNVSGSDAALVARAETDIRTRCQLTARVLREQYDRSARLLAIVDGASATDPALNDLRDRLRQRRRAAVTLFNQDLPDDAYRAGLTRTEAIEAMLFIGASQPYHELVVVAGWTPDRYEAWLADALWQLFFAPD